MKLLAIITLFASFSVFADRSVKCYEPSQQNGHMQLAFKFIEDSNGQYSVLMTYPERIRLGVVAYDADDYAWNCLENEQYNIQFCEAEGQRIRGLTPVSANDETVYCEKAIKKWIGGVPL